MAKDKKKMDAALSKLFAGKTSTPGLETLTFDLVSEFGGSKSFAKEFMKQYNGSTSSQVKAGMLRDIMFLVRLNSTKKAATDLSLYTDEELRQIAATAMDQFADEAFEIDHAAQEEATKTAESPDSQSAD